MTLRFRALLLMSAGLAGCTNLGGIPPTTTAAARSLPANAPLIPNTTLNISSAIQIPLEKLVIWGTYASAAYLILDPLAPNWEIEEAAFPGQHFHLALRMKRVYSGGAGEARQVFQQRAAELMRGNGFDGYTIVEYSEGMDSSVLGSQRVARGVIQLTRKNG